jgi:hypothetical protein
MQSVIEYEILSLVEKYCGRKNALPTMRIYADCQINGTDFVEFFDEIDRTYDVDTTALTEKTDASGAVTAIDPEIREVIDFVKKYNI